MAGLGISPWIGTKVLMPHGADGRGFLVAVNGLNYYLALEGGNTSVNYP